MGINEFIKIGDKIKLLRKNLNLTQEEMANKLSIPRSTYANYESNKREPSSEMLTKISEVLNISPIELLSIDIGSKSHTDDTNNEIQIMFDTLDSSLAIFLMLKNFKCFEDLNITNLSRSDYILLSEIISSNINSTVQSFKDKWKKDLLDKFNNIDIEKSEVTETSKVSNDRPKLTNNEATKSNNIINKLKNIIQELKKTTPKSNENLLHIEEENKTLEDENKSLEDEISMLEKELKELLNNS